MKKLLVILSLLFFLLNAYSLKSSSQSLTEAGAWGYGPCDAVYVDGTRAYIGSGKYLIVLDISNKTNPKKIGEILLKAYVRQIYVFQGYAYVANGDRGLRIINVSTPTALREISYYDTAGSTHGLYVSGDYAYLADGLDGLRIIEISTPTSPEEVGYYDTPGYSYDVYISGNYAYVGDGASGLRKIYVNNPHAPYEVGFLDTPGSIYGVYVSGNNAYVACGNVMRVISITQNYPYELGSYELSPGEFFKQVYVSGSYAYLPTSSGLRVLSISNPYTPGEVGFCPIPGDGGGIHVSENYAYVAHGSSGLSVVNIGNPTSPNELGSYNTQGFIYDIYVSGNYAYLVALEDGMIVLDVSNPVSPREVGHYNTPFRARSVFVSGRYAYLVDETHGLRIIDVFNPRSPHEVGFKGTSGNALGVYVSGNYAYVADHDKGLKVIDVSNPVSPWLWGASNTPGSACGVHVSGSYVYVAGFEAGLRVIKVSNPYFVREVGFYNTPGWARDVFVSGNYAYVADGLEGLRVISVYFPQDPSEAGYCNTPGYARGVYVSGNYAYVADLSGGVRMISVSPPYAPREVASHNTFARNLHVQGNYIYVANGNIGMTILKSDSSPPTISLDRNQVNFAWEIGGNSPGTQTFSIYNSTGGILNWTTSDNAGWLNSSPSSGRAPGKVTVSVDPAGLSAGNYTGTISIEDTYASNSPQTVNVSLVVSGPGSTGLPFGSFETPVHGSTVQSSVPVTGWVLDDIEVESVKIYRESGKNLVYIGDGLFVEGARPDVEQAYPDYPFNYRAGWGYMMLTNFLPNGGNGTFNIHAIAADTEGHQVTLGIKNITSDNANAVKPFGAIDTPTQGGTAFGSSFINWGWVLTPQPNSIPTDGSTINVWIDGVSLGHPTYDVYREDITTLFPGYANSNGAIGYFSLDTTAYESGVHTIQWTAADDAGNTDGIGSRYFTIQNTGGSAERMAQIAERKTAAFNVQCSMLRVNPLQVPLDYSSPIRIKKGYNQNIKPLPHKRFPGENGNFTIEIKELERIEIHLSEGTRGLAPLSGCTGYLVVGNQVRSLPIGSTLDTKRGIFYWQPGPGFLGRYKFVFLESGPNGVMTKKNIFVEIVPHTANLKQ